MRFIITTPYRIPPLKTLAQCIRSRRFASHVSFKVKLMNEYLLSDEDHNVFNNKQPSSSTDLNEETTLKTTTVLNNEKHLLKKQTKKTSTEANKNELIFDELGAFIKKNATELLPLSLTPPHDVHSTIEVKILELNSAGYGMSIKDHWIYFTPFVLPGEKVQIRVLKSYKYHSITELFNVIEPSKDRIKPICKHFGECNSCQFQHIPYSLQHKHQVIKNIFSPLLKDRESSGLCDIIASPVQYHYRTKMTPHFLKPFYNKNPRIKIRMFSSFHLFLEYHKIGYNNIHDKLMDIESCSLVIPMIQKKYEEYRTLIKSTLSSYQNGVSLLFRRSLISQNYSGTNAKESKSIVMTNEKKTATEIIMGYKLSFPAGGFFQIHPPMVNYMIQSIKNELRLLPNVSYLIDVYCGVGVFGIALSSCFRKILGIEVDSKLIEHGEYNLHANDITNMKFIRNDAAKLFEAPELKTDTFPEPIDFRPSETALVLDPPRVGCSRPFLEQVVKYFPKIIFYVSCYPWTQVVDARFLTDHGYVLSKIKPFDFFPQTSHIENLVILYRN